MSAITPRVGGIYELPGCPPLDGGIAGPHPVVLVRIDSGNRLVVVGCSSSVPKDRHPDKIAMPDTQRYKDCRTGFTVPTWCVPKWTIGTLVERLGRQGGFCGGKVLQQIMLHSLQWVDQDPKHLLNHWSKQAL